MSDQLKTRKALDQDDGKEIEGSTNISIDASSSVQFTKQTKREPSMFLRLIEAAILVHNSNNGGEYFDQILRGDLQELDEAVKCDIVAVDDFWGSIGYSLLEKAIKTHLVALVQVLIKYADQNTILNLVKDKCLLFFACSNGHFEVVDALLEHGADPNLMGTGRNFEGFSCLYMALSWERLNIARLLLEKGANPNLPTVNGGVTPLHQATTSDRVEAMELLLAYGADANLGTKEFDAPFIIACEGGNLEAVRLLLDHGADINVVAKAGNTPLILAVSRSDDTELLQFLLEHGADHSIANENGITALDYAEEGSEIAEMLANALLEPILK